MISLKDAEKKRPKVVHRLTSSNAKPTGSKSEITFGGLFKSDVEPLIEEFRQLTNLPNWIARSVWTVESSDTIFIFLSKGLDKFVAGIKQYPSHEFALYGCPRRCSYPYDTGEYIEMAFLKSAASVEELHHYIIENWIQNLFYYDNVCYEATKGPEGNNYLTVGIPLNWKFRLLDRIRNFIQPIKE